MGEHGQQESGTDRDKGLIYFGQLFFQYSCKDKDKDKSKEKTKTKKKTKNKTKTKTNMQHGEWRGELESGTDRNDNNEDFGLAKDINVDCRSLLLL